MLGPAGRSCDTLGAMIRRSLEIKKAMVERDEFDEGPRNVFNYGHSFGHALESTTDYAIPHGIAVGFGMDLANLVSPEWRERAAGTLAASIDSFFAQRNIGTATVSPDAVASPN